MKIFEGWKVIIEHDGNFELIGELDNSCDFGKTWRFYSKRTQKIYVIGSEISEVTATERAIKLDMYLVHQAH